MRINTNISSLNAQEAAINTDKNMSSSLEKLSSGLRINKASDDASGLAIADKLRTQKNSIGQSIDNANSAVSMIQIGDKAMAEQSNILDTVKQKLIQAGTSTTSDDGRVSIAKDINKLLTQLDDIASQTNYNGKVLLQKATDDSSSTGELVFQVGEDGNDTISTSGGMQANTNGLASNSPTLDLSDLKDDTKGDGTNLGQDDAQDYLEVIDLALNDLNTMRADFGSTQVQIESATRNLMTSKTNIAAAESVIRDIDYSDESANFSKQSIISQASTYAQTQANAAPDSVLKLLQ
jgi:flagellin